MDKAMGFWILLLLIQFVCCLTPPKTTGCTKECSSDTCTCELYCFKEISNDLGTYVIASRYNNNNDYYFDGYGNIRYREPTSHCQGVSLYGTNYYKLFLTYKGSSDMVPQSNCQICGIIFKLDLSGNNYEISPNLAAMKNLAFLNLSRNSLTVARLTDNHNLEELDLSFNSIVTIEVGQSSYMKLQTLNLSHNYLDNIPNAIFDNFSELMSLDLSYNFINGLGVASFEGLKKLTSLTLTHNKISDLNGSLFRFSRLQILDLSHNRLEKIKFKDFEKLHQLTDLNLSDNLIVAIESLVFDNMGPLKSLKLENNQLQDISTINFTNNNNLEHVDISKNSVKYLPQHLFKGKNLLFFDLKENSLEGTLSKGTFEGLGRVLKIDLSNQQLTALGDGAFSGLGVINELLLNKNNLQTIYYKSFENMTTLLNLDLSENNIIDLNFDTSDLINLRSIILRNNMITYIDINYFRGLSALQFLDLSNNKIFNLKANIFNHLNALVNFDISGNPLNGTLKSGTFDGLVSLPILDISGTQITIVENASFVGMTELKTLNISNSKISDLQFDSFVGLSAVEIIDLEHNQLRTLEINGTDLVNLKALGLSRNFLKVITDKAFIGIVNLKQLDLSYNIIETIHDEAFENLKDLQYLDISYNPNMFFNISIVRYNKYLQHIILSGLRCEIQLTYMSNISLLNLEISNSSITNISSLDFSQLTDLRNLILSSNKIKSIDFDGISNLKKIETFDLSFNNITLIQPGTFKNNEHLQLLNISHNSLTTLSYGALRGLTHLSTLDISYNNIKNLDSERFYEVPSLRVLIVDFNEIDFISTDEFVGTSLSELSIGENLIPCNILVNFKKSVLFKISALKKEENDKENVDGITCTNKITYKSTSTLNHDMPNDNLQILTDIRDVLHKIENKQLINDQTTNTNKYTGYLSNITEEVQILKNENDSKLSRLLSQNSIMINQSTNKTNQLLAIKESVNNTNQLLEKILQSLKRLDVTSNISNFDDLSRAIVKEKYDMEKALSAEKTRLDELENKIELSESKFITPAPKPLQGNLLHPKPTYNDNKIVIESKSLLFLNICVALMLCILMCFVSYKCYESRMFVRSRNSYSTRELPLESQDL